MKTEKEQSTYAPPIAARPPMHIYKWMLKAKKMRKVRMSVIINDALAAAYEARHSDRKRAATA